MSNVIKKDNKKLNYFMATMINVILLLFFVQTGQANFIKTENILKQTAEFREEGGYEFVQAEGVSSIVAAVIQAFLGLLGIIFIVLIVMAGYKWMNAAGNEEKVQEAKDTIRRAIIGLIITVSAYAITYFVFTNLPGGGGTGGTGPTGSPLQ